MTQTIQDVVGNIQGKIGALTGIRSAPSYPPEQISVHPIAIAYAQSGTVGGFSSGWMEELHNVNIDLVLASKDLTRDLTELVPFLRSIPNKIFADPTFGGHASTFEAVNYSYIVYEDGGIQYRGYRFVVTNIKITPALT